MLTRLLRQSSVYALGNLILKFSGLILHIWYLDTRFFSQEAYGYLVLLETTAQVGVVFGGLGLSTSLLKFMSDEAYAGEKKTVPFTVAVLSVFSIGLMIGGVWVTAPLLASALLDNAADTSLIMWMATYVAFKVLGTVPYTLLRTEERAGWFVAALTLETLALIGGVLFFVVYQGLGLKGVLYAWTAGAALSALLLLAAMLRRVSWTFNLRIAPRLLRFGVPLALGGLVSLFLKFGDQYLLKGYTDAATVGMYGWAYKMGSLINMLFVQSFQMAFLVLGLKALGKSRENLNLHRQTFRHFVVWTGWGVLGISLLAYDLTLALSDNDGYLEAAGLVLLIALGFLAYGLYFIMLNVLYAEEKTQSIATMVAGTALLNIILNVILIPQFGAWGAAVATFLSYVVLMGLATYLAERAVRVQYPWVVLAGVLMLTVGLYLIAQLSNNWESPFRVGFRFLLLLSYPTLIFAFRIYTREEIHQARTWLRTRRETGGHQEK